MPFEASDPLRQKDNLTNSNDQFEITKSANERLAQKIMQRY